MSEIDIHTEDLRFAYEDSAAQKASPALDGITVDIREGEYVAVLGHNGSGKSTFAKLLNLLLEPTGGRLVIGGVELTGRELTDEEILALRRDVGMVFQNPDNQLVATVVEEDVAFGPENLGIPQAELRALAWTAHWMRLGCGNTRTTSRTDCRADRSSELRLRA